MAQRNRNQVPAPASAVRALNDMLVDLEARLILVERALSAVIDDIYDPDVEDISADRDGDEPPEPADNIGGHDRATRDAERERQGSSGVEQQSLNLVGNPSDEPTDEELEWWSRQEAARLRAEAEADFDPRGQA